MDWPRLITIIYEALSCIYIYISVFGGSVEKSVSDGLQKKQTKDMSHIWRQRISIYGPSLGFGTALNSEKLRILRWSYDEL